MAASPLKLSLESLSSFGIFVISEPLGTLNAQQQQPPMNPMAAASAALPADERCNHFAFCGSKEPSASDAFVSSHNDATIRVTNAATGKISGLFHVKDAGCRLVTATHHPSAVIHAASKGGPQSGRIVLHSLHDDKIIRLFEGHSDFVSSISMNPADDTFLTCSRDGTFKMWDLRQRAPIAAGDLHSKGAAACAFDSGGVVFACVTGNRMLSLYDAKTFTSFASTKEPLLQQTVMPGRYPPGPQGTAIPGLAPPPPETLNAGLSAAKAMASVGAPPMPPYIAWTGIEFSPNDRFLAMSTADRGVLIVDAFFPARELALLNSHPTDHLQPCNVSWSPDGSFLATGSVDGHVYCYDLSGKPTDESVIGVDDTSGLTLPDLPYHPKRWSPPFTILGEALKPQEARQKARSDASKYLPDYRKALHKRYKEAEASLPAGSQLKVNLPNLAVPEAADADEQISRHEGPVRAVKWHPTKALIATGSQAIALWAPQS